MHHLKYKNTPGFVQLDRNASLEEQVVLKNGSGVFLKAVKYRYMSKISVYGLQAWSLEVRGKKLLPLDACKNTPAML